MNVGRRSLGETTALWGWRVGSISFLEAGGLSKERIRVGRDTD